MKMIKFPKKIFSKQMNRKSFSPSYLFKRKMYTKDNTTKMENQDENQPKSLLPQDKTGEIVVIGAGITGMIAACEIASLGSKVLVLEENELLIFLFLKKKKKQKKNYLKK